MLGIGIYRKPKYLCNQVVDVTKGKCTFYWDKVTCKNCLKHMPNYLKQNETKNKNKQK